MRKTNFVNNAVDTVNQLAWALERAEKLMTVWFARGYSQGNANQFADTDLQDFGLSVSDLQNIMYLLDSFSKYMRGQDAPKANFVESIAKYRNDV
jgi:hypothetical protein